MLDTLGAVSRREQKQQILEEISWHHAVHAGYISRNCTKKSAEIFYNPWVQEEAKHSKSAKVKKEAKITRLGQIGYRKSQVLPEDKYHPKRHLSTQKPNLSWIRTGVDKTSNLCDRSGHKSSKTLWQKSSQNPQEVHKCAEVSHFEIEAKQRRSRPFWNWSQTKTSRPFWIHVKQRRLITSVF